jgi:hypothetical protein
MSMRDTTSVMMIDGVGGWASRFASLAVPVLDCERVDSAMKRAFGRV